MQWHDVQQGTEEWQQLRCGKATASNFGTFMANDGKAFEDPARRYALQSSESCYVSLVWFFRHFMLSC